jgi:hypothetical protein
VAAVTPTCGILPTMTERIVGFLDVLGFSDQVKSQTQAELAELYRRLIKGAYEHTTVIEVPDDWRKWQGGEAYFEKWRKPLAALSM